MSNDERPGKPSVHVHEAAFVRGCSNLTSLPPRDLPEIAVIGRSNVGKSSFINRITQRRSLARTSATPGRTQEFNFFDVDFSLTGAEPDSPKRRHSVRLVDLPGFGFARFSKEKREALGEMTLELIETRENLVAVCILNDVRRDPEEEERALQAIAFEAEREVIIVLTKADKLKRNELEKRRVEGSRLFGLQKEDVLVTGEGISPFDFWERIETVIQSED